MLIHAGPMFWSLRPPLCQLLPFPSKGVDGVRCTSCFTFRDLLFLPFSAVALERLHGSLCCTVEGGCCAHIPPPASVGDGGNRSAFEAFLYSP